MVRTRTFADQLTDGLQFQIEEAQFWSHWVPPNRPQRPAAVRVVPGSLRERVLFVLRLIEELEPVVFAPSIREALLEGGAYDDSNQSDVLLTDTLATLYQDGLIDYCRDGFFVKIRLTDEGRRFVPDERTEFEQQVYVNGSYEELIKKTVAYRATVQKKSRD